MNAYRRPIALLASLTLWMAACSPDDTTDDPGAQDHHDHAAWATLSFDSAESLRQAAPSGVLAVAPESGEFRQIGMILDGELPREILHRVTTGDGHWSDWKPLEVTWSEEIYHVARVLLDEPATELELKAGESLEAITFEFYDGVQADPSVITRELPLAQSDGDQEVGTIQQGLAPSSLVISRSAWGARHPNKACGASHSPYRMTIHHTGIPASDGGNPAARMRQMQAFHIDSRGWCDIGYHFVVSQSGRIYQGRSSSQRTGAHVGNQNTGNIGISLIGDYATNRPGNTQLNATADIVRWVHQRYGIALNRNRVKGHGEWPGQWTTCPGSHLLNQIPTILSRAASSSSTSSGSSTTSSGSSGSSSSSSTPTWYLSHRFAGGSADINFQFARDSDIPIVGDWNGDGRMTPGVVRGNTWYLKNSHSGGGADITFRFGRSSDTPIVGDWNGDGRWTAGVVRENTWFLKNDHSGGNSDLSFRYGRSTDTPIVGDWNGDGRMTAGVVRGNTWFLQNDHSGGSSDLSFNYGRSSDTPIVGDWNGDGHFSPGVVRGNTWFLKNDRTSGTADFSFQFGRSSDLPIAGDWNRDGEFRPGVVR